jgi:periodic tryptophan protein 1
MTKDGEGFGVSVGADIECVRWDPWSPTSFYVSSRFHRPGNNRLTLSQVSLENGLVLAYDARTLSSSKGGDGLSAAAPKYTLSAHDGGATALDINPHIRGCIATGGMDKTVKIWNVADEETEGVAGRKREVSLVTSRDLSLGKVFTARWNPDPETPLTLAAAGSKACVQVWDVASNAGARQAFGQRLKRHGRELSSVKAGGGVVQLNHGEESEEED